MNVKEKSIESFEDDSVTIDKDITRYVRKLLKTFTPNMGKNQGKHKRFFNKAKRNSNSCSRESYKKDNKIFKDKALQDIQCRECHDFGHILNEYPNNKKIKGKTMNASLSDNEYEENVNFLAFASFIEGDHDSSCKDMSNFLAFHHLRMNLRMNMICN